MKQVAVRMANSDVKLIKRACRLGDFTFSSYVRNAAYWQAHYDVDRASMKRAPLQTGGEA